MPDFDFRYLLLAGLAIALLVAAVTDIRRRQIDNWLTLGIAAAAPLYWWASGMAFMPDIAWQLGLAAITFAVLFGMFALRVMGGGDVKLLTALALWITPLWFMQLVIVMSIIGGLLTLAMWINHRARKRQGRLAIPYGVAIACAGLWALFAQHRALFHLPANAAGLG
ncbi:prepilin peptidase [Novosphingobium sp.]|uniref:A24 family peptidase n=1 Tax=Novosphingobium sp. TaxID=1874826 RepID=UPI0027354503|nr:prepilin peptidase [Novosphingobium sp.]MDP3908081.1 prepilin peptidase [Novosphingobium sp.]